MDVYQNENKERKTYPIIVKLKNQNLKKTCIDFRKNNNFVDIEKLGPEFNGHNANANINFYHLIEINYRNY